MKITRAHLRLAASDVANFLACRRLTQLDLLMARKELRPLREFDIGFQDLVRRGEVHERAVLERFRADGLDVVDVSRAEDGARATREATQDGAGGRLSGNAWRSRRSWAANRSPGRSCPGCRRRPRPPFTL